MENTETLKIPESELSWVRDEHQNNSAMKEPKNNREIERERENGSQAQQGYVGDLAVHAALKYVSGWSKQREILCAWQRLHFRQVLVKTLSEPVWLYPHILTCVLGNSHQQQLFSFYFQIPQTSAALALTPQLSPFIWLAFRAYSFCTPSALWKASYDKATEGKLETSASVMD